MKSKLLWLLFLTTGAHAQTFYYAGKLEVRETANGKVALTETAYKREINEDTKEIIETCDLILEGKRYKEIYAYDHKTKTLKIRDRMGKVISNPSFVCEGSFPNPTSCHYDFKAAFEMHGEDKYLGDKAIVFNSTMKDLKSGIAWVTDGKLSAVPVSEYRKALGHIEQTPFTE